MWSVFDAKDGFHQMILDEKSRACTTFCTTEGTFCWKVMPMGIKNGPSMFQRFMSSILDPKKFPNVFVYVDDIIIGSTGSTPEEIRKNHERDVSRVLEALRDHQVYLKGSKSAMFCTEIKFCGHVLSNGTRRAAPKKLEAISKWEPDQIKTVTHMKGFLGLAGWLQIYVPNFAKLAAPLNDAIGAKLAPEKKITWTHSMKVNFEKIKSEVLKNAILHIPDTSKPYIMECDASGYAVGGVLKQLDSDGNERPVAFFSRKLSGEVEKRTGQCGWSPREQETYAIITCLEKFQDWIAHNAVSIKCHTDHRSLEHWKNERLDCKSGPLGRRHRWHEFLSRFPNLEVIYLPGKDNSIADCLSRWAYSANQVFNDTTVDGSNEDHEFAQENRIKERDIIPPAGFEPHIVETIDPFDIHSPTNDFDVASIELVYVSEVRDQDWTSEYESDSIFGKIWEQF